MTHLAQARPPSGMANKAINMGKDHNSANMQWLDDRCQLLRCGDRSVLATHKVLSSERTLEYERNPIKMICKAGAGAVSILASKVENPICLIEYVMYAWTGDWGITGQTRYQAGSTVWIVCPDRPTSYDSY